MAEPTEGRAFFPEDWELQIAPWPWALSLDVGSDFTRQAIGLVGYNFDLFAKKDASFAAGYRALGPEPWGRTTTTAAAP